MRDVVDAFEELITKTETKEDKIVYIMLLDVLAGMAANLEEQKGQIDRITEQMNIIAKGGKVVTGDSSGGRPFSIG
jgi:nitric oxide reductase activation protein